MNSLLYNWGDTNAKKIIKCIIDSKKVAILPHINADGDALGSSFALAIALNKIKKNVKVFLEEPLPDMYSFLDTCDLYEEYKFNKEYFDVVIVLDSGDLSRLGLRESIFNDANLTINIDHHRTNPEFAFYNLVDYNASSVGEMVFGIIKEMNVEIDSLISNWLYIAIASDTGGFKYSNTTPITHEVVAEIMKNEIDISDISKRLFDNMSYGKLRLMGEIIQKIEIVNSGKIAVVVIDDNILNSLNAAESDFDGLINIGRNLENVEVSLIIRKKQSGDIKVNLRSNYYVDVSKIAGKYSGGGHKRAAGCIVKGELDKIKSNIIKDISDVL